MRKAYYLSTCDTCKRILNEVNWQDDLVDIKKEQISAHDLEFLYNKIGSYEALFNKRARKYKDPEIKASIQSDEDFKKAILEEYTFLKRPVFIIDGLVFVGNSKKTIEDLKAHV